MGGSPVESKEIYSMSAFKSFLALPNLAAEANAASMVETYTRQAREERARVMAGFLAGMIGALRRWNARRRTEAALRNLDDRILSDIGLTRAEIRQISHGHYLVDMPVSNAPALPPSPANTQRAGQRAA
jgi:uncharacterized protein YjiS (DUF1127 family)